MTPEQALEKAQEAEDQAKRLGNNRHLADVRAWPRMRDRWLDRAAELEQNAHKFA